MKRIVIVMLLGFLGLACQDYSFEELPSSVIKRKSFTQTINVASEVDILFVIDNSGSMLGEQQNMASSFESFVNVLDERFGLDKYHIGIVTTTMLSPECPNCSPDRTSYCIHEFGESGTFQFRLGSYVIDEAGHPIFSFDFNDCSRNCRR